jgi:Predicted pyridoxal phosphate-dependent enzyme apparently involved in regulation of cell wall biogenesis
MAANSGKIGGEFDISPDSILSESPNDVTVFASGRHAFRAILQDLRLRGIFSIWLPEYLCDSVIAATEKESFRIGFYEIDSRLLIKREYVSRIARDPSSAVLLIDYFGLTDLTSRIEMLKNANICVVVDMVQAYFKNPYLQADYWFNSLRKFLPVPEGALAYKGCQPMLAPSRTSDFSHLKMLGGFIKNIASRVDIDDRAYLSLFEKGEAVLDSEESICSTSGIYASLIRRIDIEDVKRRRINNASALRKLLSDSGIPSAFDGSELDSAPLAIPLLLENRDDIRQSLKHEGVFLPVHWPGRAQGPLSDFYAKHELSLVIDQRYSDSDIEYMFSALVSKKPKFIRYDND